MSSFLADLLVFVNEEVRIADVPVTHDTELLLSGVIDSLGVIQIVEWIERSLTIAIDPSDVILENFESVDRIAAYVRDRTQGSRE